MDKDQLDKDLMKAHEADDLPALVRLYKIAGDAAEQADDEQAAGFYLTHAFVFALEQGAPEADELNKRLADMGRAKRLKDLAV